MEELTKYELEYRTKLIIDAIFNAIGHISYGSGLKIHVRVDDTYTIWQTKTLWYVLNRKTGEKKSLKINGKDEISRLIGFYLREYGI